MSKQPKKRVPRASDSACLLLQRFCRMVLAKKEKQRRAILHGKKNNIAMELLQTERIYVKNLKILEKNFLIPIQFSNDPVLLTVTNLVANINQITSVLKVIISYHCILLQQLEERLSDNLQINTKLGGIFMEMSSYLKTYTQYVTHYQPTLRELKDNRENEKLTKFFNFLTTDDCKGKGLKDYLIMPIQRIPRYNMMLADLLCKTWKDHCDYNDLKEASVSIEEICQHVENMSEKASKLEKKMEIVKLVHISRKWNFSLTAPHCYFKWEDDCDIKFIKKPTEETTHLINGHLFVFSDVLLVCQTRTSKKKYKTFTYILLTEMTEKQKFIINGEETYFLYSKNVEVQCKPTKDTKTNLFKNLDDFSLEFNPSLSPIPNRIEKEKNTERRTIRIRQSSPNIVTRSKSNDRPRNSTLERRLSIKNLKNALPRRNSLAHSADGIKEKSRVLAVQRRSSTTPNLHNDSNTTSPLVEQEVVRENGSMGFLNFC